MMDRAVFDEIQKEFNEVLPALLKGEPDRTDLMIPLCRAQDWLYDRSVGQSEVKSAILEVYGISMAELYSRSRRDEVVIEARQMAAYVMVKNAGMTNSAAGRAIRRDRTTVMYSVEKMADLVTRSPEIARHHQRVLRIVGVFE